MSQVVESTAWSSPAFAASAQRALEFRGHLSHTVGMDVHDGGDYPARPLVPGTVFSIDPQIWIPEENLYIRMEDTVVVTQDGVENLTELAPMELDDIELLMKDEGMIDELPHLNLNDSR